MIARDSSAFELRVKLPRARSLTLVELRGKLPSALWLTLVGLRVKLAKGHAGSFGCRLFFL